MSVRRVERQSVKFVVARDHPVFPGIDKFAEGFEDRPIVRTTVDGVSG